MSRWIGNTRPWNGIALPVLLLALAAGRSAAAFSQTTISPPQVARELSEAFVATAKATMPSALRAARQSGQALLLIRRGQASRFVVVRFGGQGQE